MSCLLTMMMVMDDSPFSRNMNTPKTFDWSSAPMVLVRADAAPRGFRVSCRERVHLRTCIELHMRW
jgi:hypothetical protein